MKKELYFGIAGIIFIAAIVIFTLFRYGDKAPAVSQNNTNNNGKTGYTSSQVAEHNSVSDCWIIINNKIYEVDYYLDTHPGGAQAIISYCGLDATEAFETKGGRGQHSASAANELEKYYIGDLNN